MCDHVTECVYSVCTCAHVSMCVSLGMCPCVQGVYDVYLQCVYVLVWVCVCVCGLCLSEDIDGRKQSSKSSFRASDKLLEMTLRTNSSEIFM